MKLLDKIKDLFMDEVDVDDEIEIEEEHEEKKPVEKMPEVKREEKSLPKVMVETFKREEKNKERTILEDERKTKKTDLTRENIPKKFDFPFDFETKVASRSNVSNMDSVLVKREEEHKKNDVEELSRSVNNTRNVNVLDLKKETAKKTSELYSNKEMAKEKPKFKATPVISPVYGILDKNYTKEEVKERDEEMVEMKRPSKKVDFETVRKKAFGNLADDIKDNMMCENCELYKEVKRISSLTEDNLLYDMTVDDEDVTIEKAYDNYEEFGVAYEPKKPSLEIEENVNEDRTKDELKLEDIIADASEKIESPVINEDDEVIGVLDKPNLIYADKIDEEEKPVVQEAQVEEVPSRSVKKKETKVDEDFFELIDSMYKERDDE